MQINKHSSFYLRNGWPTKIIDAIPGNPYIFSPANELAAVDSLGVGRVMVKAMRYWAYTTGITSETKDQQGVYHQLSDIGTCIQEFDPYCQYVGTLWLLHRNLARDDNNATMWEWAFNSFGHREFTKEQFVDAFFAYYQANGGTNKKAAIEKEFDCFKNTYVSDKRFDLEKIIEEDTIPFLCRFLEIKNLSKDVLRSIKNWLANNKLTPENIKGTALDQSAFVWDDFVNAEELARFLGELEESPFRNKESFFCGECFGGWEFFNTENELIQAFSKDYDYGELWENMNDEELPVWFARLFEEEQSFELPINLSIIREIE